jgi:hypoxanthine phosphoribosyltransferase
VHPDLETVLLTKEQIDQRVTELAREISEDYRDKTLVLVAVLKGGIIFMADLTRKLEIRHSYDVVGAASYGKSTVSSGQVIITKDIDVDVSKKDVLLVEDIYDTGRTMKAVCDLIMLHGPSTLEICTFLYKEKSRPVNLPVKYIGFRIPDEFVVGYGLDYDEQYRNLECVGVLKKKVYS